MPIGKAAIAALNFLCVGERQEGVSFATQDGGVVYADVYGTGDRGVVLTHCGRFTKESWTTQAQALASAGFRVTAIDFRGRGQSRGGPQSTSHDGGFQFDVLAAVRYLQGTGAKTAHSAIEEPERMQGRKLFITSRGDTTGSGTLRLPGIREQYERAPGPKELVVLDGSAHAQFIFETSTVSGSCVRSCDSSPTAKLL